MKKFINISVVILIFCAAFLIAGCAGVTETGNPQPAGSSSPYFTEDANAYINSSFGVTIMYPESWEYTEAEDGASVTFVSTENDADKADITFSRLDPIPESLFAYLSDAYPDRSFTRYLTTKFSGYSYDDPNVGENGGDLREYFFLSGDVLIQVAAELTDWGKAEVGALLDGISVE